MAITVAFAVMGAPVAAQPQNPTIAIASASGVDVTPLQPKLPSGGPYIGVERAMELARLQATGPITRQEVRFMRYGEISAFLGPIVHTLHADREFYAVVTSARHQMRPNPAGPGAICNSYFTFIDATDGTVFALTCGGADLWPKRLPPAFLN